MSVSLHFLQFYTISCGFIPYCKTLCKKNKNITRNNSVNANDLRCRLKQFKINQALNLNKPLPLIQSDIQTLSCNIEEIQKPLHFQVRGLQS